MATLELKEKQMIEIKNKNGEIILEIAGANLRKADLHGANLRKADLYEADLCEANLREADLCEANLREADLHGADLRKADLCGADLYGADLCGADLRGADLYGADLYGADLRGADLRGADLRAKQKIIVIYNYPHKIHVIDNQVSIGCIVHDISYWLLHYEEIGVKYHYTSAQIAEYKMHLNHIKDILEISKSGESRDALT